MKRLLPGVARECGRVAGLATAIVVPVVILSWHKVYKPSDAPLFLAVARNPFGDGTHFVGRALVQGVAYRYGRIGFPIVGWALALGRPAATRVTLAITFVVAFAAWVALAGEHLRRGGRSPRLALWIFATPCMLLWLAIPDIVSEPMAGALVLLAYLYERDGRARGARVAAALAILTREQMLVAFVPLAWRDWKRRRWLAVRDWSCVVAPYVAWCAWVRVRVGTFPFTDPASSRRDALTLPLVGWYRTLRAPLNNGQGWAVIIAFATVVLVGLIAAHGKWRYPITHGAVALALLSLCYGVSVFRFPGEAVRVLAPTQMLLIIAALDRSDRGSAAVTDGPFLQTAPPQLHLGKTSAH